VLAIEAVPNNDPVNDPEIEDPDTPPSTFKAAPVPCINKLPDSSALPENGNPTPVPDVPLVPLVPFVPLVPLDPEDPDVPLVPLVPLDPEDPDVPLVPLVPLDPEEPDVPLVPLVPLEPLEPLDPLEPLVPDVPGTDSRVTFQLEYVPLPATDSTVTDKAPVPEL